MLSTTARKSLVLLLAIALVTQQQAISTSLAAEPQPDSPQAETYDSTNLPLPSPPLDDFDSSANGDADQWEDLPLELDDAAAGESIEAQTARRGPDRSAMAGPFGGGRDGSPIGYRAFGEPTVDVDGQPTTFEHWGQEIRLALPAWTGDPHLVLLSTSITNDLYDTAAVFPRSDVEFPESLWNIRLGANYIRTFANDWRLGTGVSIGSASDRPFGAIRDVNPAVFSFLRIPRENGNAWNLSLFYSPLSEIPFPIPGVAYYWHASDELQMNIGHPAQLTWQPTEQFQFTASYMLLHTINARGTWRLDENWSVYLAYENRNRAWFLHDRQNDDERLFIYDQGVLVGLERRFLENFKPEIAAGYLFGRFSFLGERYSDRNHDRIDFDPGATISAQCGLTW